MTKEELISMMAGDMSEMFQRERFDLSDEIILEIKNFTRAGKYQDVSFCGTERGKFLVLPD